MDIFDMRTGLAIAALLALYGCADPIIGDWAETNGDCSKDGDFTVDDELGVSGTLYIPDGTGACLSCDFDGDVKNEDDGEYSADIDFENCNCGGDSSGEAKCDMNDDENELDCTLTISPQCGELSSSWEKQE